MIRGDTRIKQQDREISRLRGDLAQVNRDRGRWKRHSERLQQQLDTARRAGFRQAAPFAKDRPQGRGGRPGRRAGARYGRQACRRRPAQVDETHAAPVPAACPDCGGAIEVTRVASQYQEEIPEVRPVVRRFDIEVGHCSQCQRRVQGRHALQTSDALGAAGAQLGPGVVALVVELHTEMGVPLAKVAHVLRTTFGLQVTPGGLSHLLHRTARDAAPTYTALCEQVRNSPVVTPDETGWRVGAISHWLWAFVTPETTVWVHVRKVRGFVPGYRTRLDRPTICQWMDCQHEDPIMPDEQIAALERQHAHLRSQFASIGEMRSGSLTERFRPCGKPRCHCAKPGDPGHGPVLSLTRKQAGKTVTRIIPAHAGSETQARLAEYRRFRQLSKMFIEVNDALSEARLATGSAAKKNRRPR